MKKRVVSAMLAVAMVGSLMAACSNNNGGGGTSSGGSATDRDYDSGELYAKAKMSEEPISPKFMLRTNETFTKDTEAYKWIGEITNIYFEPVPVPLSAYDEKISAVMASGDLPDFQALRTPIIAKQYGPQGAFVNLSEQMDNGKMPNLVARLDEGPDDAYTVLKAPDGNIYGAPRIYTYDMLHESFAGRADLMQKWGFGERFETFDDLYKYFQKCKEEYPDSTPVGSKWGVDTLFNGFGHQWDAWIDLAYLNPADKKTYIAGPLQPNFKPMLEYFHNMYKDGILDPEWASCSDEQFKEKILNDKIFFSFEYMSETDEMDTSGKTRNPEFSWKPFIPPAYGDRMKVGVADCYHRIYQTLKCISAKSKYIDELVQFTDWMYSKEGSDVINYGKKGETFDYDDNGNVVLDEKVKTSNNLGGTIDLAKIGVAAEWTSIESEENEKLKSLGPIAIEAQKKHREAGAVMFQQPSLTFEDEDLNRRNELSAPMTTYRQEMMTKFTTGEEPISNYDKFVEQLKAYGIEELVAIYQKTYDAQMALADK